MSGVSRGPARFFRDHPLLFQGAVALAAGSAILLEARSALAKGTARKVGWSLLALLEWGIVAGLLTLPKGDLEESVLEAPGEAPADVRPVRPRARPAK